MFHPRSARALKAGEHLIVEQAPGLRLEATASGQSWIYRYRSPVDGRMRQLKLGRWPALGLPAALAAWQRVKAQRDSGGDPAAQRRERRQVKASKERTGRLTVARVRQEFLAAYEGCVASKTYAEAKRLLERELAPLQEREASSITRADAFDLLDAMRDRPVVAANVRRLAGAAWERALDSGRLKADTPNWWRLVLRGKLASRGKRVAGQHQGVQKRVLGVDELGLLLPWLPNFTKDIEDALVLYLWTCCRGAEIVAMERSEIAEEPDGVWWTIPRTKLKMRRNASLTDLRVPLVGRAEAVVRRRLAATEKGFLFHSRGRSSHIEQKAVGVAVYCHMPDCELRPEWVRPRLPVANWAPHDLRRTGRTLLASLGCPNEVAEAILGHLPPGVQKVYNRHDYDRERRHWLSRLDVELERLARAKT
jgi:integrase